MAKAGRLPFMQWFVEDWLTDLELSRCAPSTRGIWCDAICQMHREGRTGTLKGTTEELARLCRCSPQEMVAAVKELEKTGAANARFCNGVVTLVNRRMQKEHKHRENTAERQRKHRCEPSNVTPTSRPASRPLSRAPSESENQRIRSDIETSTQNSVSLTTDVFQTLKKSDLSDARKLLAWMPSAVAAGVIGDSENDRLNIVAAGLRAARLGKRSPIGLFRTLVVGAKWADLSTEDIDAAASAIKLLGKSATPLDVPVLKSVPDADGISTEQRRADLRKAIEAAGKR